MLSGPTFIKLVAAAASNDGNLLRFIKLDKGRTIWYLGGGGARKNMK